MALSWQADPGRWRGARVRGERAGQAAGRRLSWWPRASSWRW